MNMFDTIGRVLTLLRRFWNGVLLGFSPFIITFLTYRSLPQNLDSREFIAILVFAVIIWLGALVSEVEEEISSLKESVRNFNPVRILQQGRLVPLDNSREPDRDP